MLVIFAAFEEQEKAEAAVERLKAAGIRQEDITLAKTAQSELVQDLMNETAVPETGKGAVVGATLGSLLGLAGGATIFTIAGPGEAIASTMVSTTIGAAIGTYLGSIYGNRAASEDELSVKEALIHDKLVLVVTVNEYDQALIENTLQESGGESITSHELYAEETVEDEAQQD
jgi:hypothetical protein